jgi:hypothetical protein
MKVEMVLGPNAKDQRNKAYNYVGKKYLEQKKPKPQPKVAQVK